LDDLRLLNYSVGRFRGGSRYEVADATVLNFSGAFHGCQRIGCDTRLNADSRSSLLARHSPLPVVQEK
jgi:hypothetical protein